MSSWLRQHCVNSVAVSQHQVRTQLTSPLQVCGTHRALLLTASWLALRLQPVACLHAGRCSRIPASMPWSGMRLQRRWAALLRPSACSCCKTTAEMLIKL